MTDTPESNPVLLAERRLAEILAARGSDTPTATRRSAGRSTPEYEKEREEDLWQSEAATGESLPAAESDDGACDDSAPEDSSSPHRGDPRASRFDPAGPDTSWTVAQSQAVRSGGPSVQRAKEACLRLLTVRARSRAELAGRLTEKGFTEPVVTAVLEQLTEVGLVDDAAFADQWVRSRHTHSGKGRAVIAEELRRKGIANQTAAAALATIDPEEERQRATELVRRKLRATSASLDPDKKFRRLVAMLARRGYPQSLALSVVRGELSQTQTPDEQR